VVDELARRFGTGDIPVSVTLRDIPAATRQAVADLLGADRVRLATSRLAVGKLIAGLGLASVGELRDVVERLRGPLPDRRAAREAAQAARHELWSWLGESAGTVQLGGPEARLASWVERQRATGARGGVETHPRRLAQALAVLRRLPADGIALPSLANDVTGDPHALDHGRTVAGMVLDAVACAYERPEGQDAEAARSLWELVGVVPDPHSSTVLALGLPGDDRTPLGRWLLACAEASEPVVLSLSNLRHWPVGPVAGDGRVYAVENPSLIAEASSGWTGPPLVCTSGRPTIAVVTLLRQLASDGAFIYQHADFDPTGLAITGWLAQQAGSVPWRMTATDYLGSLTVSAPLFAGEPPKTAWDPALQGAMSHHRKALYEEEIRAELLRSMLEAVVAEP
jgi:uncharacterized protein (TIGR02679 family)